MNAFERMKGQKTVVPRPEPRPFPGTPPPQPPGKRPASMLQPVDYVDETDYEPGSVGIPVPLKFRDAYVAADQDLFWLAEHGELERAARKLAALRAMVEARRKPPEWARYSARCCRSPVYSTHPFTFNDGCGAGSVAATEVTG